MVWVKCILIAVSCVLLAASGCLPLKKAKHGGLAEPVDGDTAAVDVKKKFKKWKKKLFSDDSNIQTAAAVSLVTLEYYDAHELLIEVLKENKEEDVTVSVLKAFGFTGDDRALREIIPLLDDESEGVRIAASETLGKLNTYKALRLMTFNLLNSQRSITSRVSIANALGDVRNRDAVEPLITALKSKNVLLQDAAHDALGKITRQQIGKDVGRWKEWWDTNRVKSREEWLEEIVERLEDNIKQMETENRFLTSEIIAKSIELLEEYSSNNSDVRRFLEAVNSNIAEVRVFAANEIAKRNPPEAKDIFTELLLDENLEVRIVAARALGEIADKSTLGALLEAVNDENSDLVVAVIKALGRIDVAESVERLIVLLASDDAKVVRSAVEALGQIGDSRVIAHFLPLLNNEDPQVRGVVAMALGKIKDSRSTEPLIKALADKEEKVRWYAADSLGKLEARKAVGDLVELLSDKSARVRESATTSLGLIGDEGAIESLTKMLDDPDERVVGQASDALLLLAGNKLDALDNLSDIFFGKEDYDRAITIMNKQLEKYSENEEVVWKSRIRLARSLVLTANWEKAADLYTILVEHFFDDIELEKELLHCTLELKQYERSLDLLARWISGPNSGKKFYWKSRLDIATMFYDSSEYKKAAELIDKFEDENPDMGGRELKMEFITLRERCIARLQEIS